MLRFFIYEIINVGLILILYLVNESSKLIKMIRYFFFYGIWKFLSI